MENKFLAIIIVYVIIASSALTFITGDSTSLTGDVSVNQNISFSDYSESDIEITGDYLIDENYGVYSQNITLIPLLGTPLIPVCINFPVKYSSDNSYTLKIHVYNPNNGNYRIDYNTNALLTYWVEVDGESLIYHDGFGRTKYDDVISESEYDMIISVDNVNNEIVITLPGKTITESYDSLQLLDLNTCTITINDNYLYISSIQVQNDANPTTEDINILTQLGLILLWNVEGLPIWVNLIFIKVPLIMVGVAIFQLIRGN